MDVDSTVTGDKEKKEGEEEKKEGEEKKEEEEPDTAVLKNPSRVLKQ